MLVRLPRDKARPAVVVRYSDIGEVIGHLDPPTMRAITPQMAIVLGIGSARR